MQNKSLNNINTSFKTILIKGISSEITKKDIINYFQQFGEIESVIINSNNQTIDLKGIIFNIKIKLGIGFVVFNSPLSVNYCLKEKQHCILGNWIYVERVKENKNKNKNFLEQNAYPTYETISQKKKNWKSKNHQNLIRSFSNLNSYEEPPYLNPSKTLQNSLFIYQNYDSDKSNNNSIIDENEIISKSNLNTNENKQNLINENNQNLLKQNLTGNCNNIIKNCKEDEIDTSSTNNSNHNSNNNNLNYESSKYENLIDDSFSNYKIKNKFHNEKKNQQKNSNNNFFKEKNNQDKIFQDYFNNHLKNPLNENCTHYKLFDVNGEEISNLSSYQNIIKIPLFKSDTSKSEKDSNSDSNNSNSNLQKSNKIDSSSSNNFSKNKNTSSSNSYSQSKNSCNSDSNSLKNSGSNSDNNSTKSEKNSSSNNSQNNSKGSKTPKNIQRKKKYFRFKKCKSEIINLNCIIGISLN